MRAKAGTDKWSDLHSPVGRADRAEDVHNADLRFGDVLNPDTGSLSPSPAVSTGLNYPSPDRIIRAVADPLASAASTVPISGPV